MKHLILKSFAGLLFLVVIMGVILFASAGTLHYWQGWSFLAVFGGSSLLITLYLMKYDRALLERRVRGGPTEEKELVQKIIQAIASLGFILILLTSGLGHRFSSATVSDATAIIGDLLIALGFLIIFFVFKENTFTAATIQLYEEQTVVSTGLYGLVRHPMYMGALVMMIGMSISLGSLWGLLCFIIMLPFLIWRIFDEERLLKKDLPGYTDYVQKTKFRLIPFIW